MILIHLLTWHLGNQTWLNGRHRIASFDEAQAVLIDLWTPFAPKRMATFPRSHIWQGFWKCQWLNTFWAFSWRRITWSSISFNSPLLRQRWHQNDLYQLLYIKICICHRFLSCVQDVQRIVIKTVGIFFWQVFIKGEILNFCRIVHSKFMLWSNLVISQFRFSQFANCSKILLSIFR